MVANIRDFTDLRVYAAAREAALRVYRLTAEFPREEKQGLTQQVRCSTRSVVANIAEAWAKRRYPAAFRAKIIDAAGEADESRSWIDIAAQCGLLAEDEASALKESYRKIAAHLVRMSANPDAWRVG